MVCCVDKFWNYGLKLSSKAAEHVLHWFVLTLFSLHSMQQLHRWHYFRPTYSHRSISSNFLTVQTYIPRTVSCGIEKLFSLHTVPKPQCVNDVLEPQKCLYFVRWYFSCSLGCMFFGTKENGKHGYINYKWVANLLVNQETTILSKSSLHYSVA